MAAATATKDGKASQTIFDADRDSLHILPMSIVPLQTMALRRARLIKNAHLDTVIEMFTDAHTGSGQLDIGKLGKVFNWPESPRPPDWNLIWKLSTMPSFDVYSLRILFRENSIRLEEDSALHLSPAKIQELTPYMAAFTRPLLQEIYGKSDIEIENFSDMLDLFRNPDVKKIQERLQIMSDKLGIGVLDIPNFLEDYADIFLSLSYYRQCLDTIVPTIDDFLESMDDFNNYLQLRNDEKLISSCKKIREKINESLSAISGRFENFERNTRDMWNNLTAERFRKLEQHIKGYHTSTGGVLCALSVKMDAWNRKFPVKKAGSPVRRAEFVMSEMLQGLDRIEKIDVSTQLLSAIND
ncbi:MAG TPA: hypothetical protein VGO34_07200 [Alphaproteobacteria bacterium]